MKDHVRHDKVVKWRVTLSVRVNVYFILFLFFILFYLNVELLLLATSGILHDHGI